MIATIGNFDGLHLGHQSLILQLVTKARALQLPAMVITFEPLPQVFLRPHIPFLRLMTLRQKVDLLKSWGVDKVICLRFNRAFSQLSPQEFIEQYLVKTFNIHTLMGGEDFRFGHQQQGDITLLKNTGFEVSIFEKLPGFSSTQVRQALMNDDLSTVKALLGRNYSMQARVVKGLQRGRLLGFPTANCKMHRTQELLKGVFATCTQVDGKIYRSVTNIGTRPTVDGKNYVAETHLLDFTGNLYGKRISIEFLHKIRDEKRFENVEQLRQQIALDIKRVVNDKNRL